MSVVSTSDLSDLNLTEDSDDNIDLSADNAQVPVEDAGESDLSVAVADDSSDNDKSSDSAKSTSDNKQAADDSEESEAEDFPLCNLTFNKTGDKKVQVGDTVTWKINIKNSKNMAWNVHVDEYLPKGFTLVSVKVSKGEYNKEMNFWEVGNLKESESAYMIVKAKAKKAGNFTNKVRLLTDSYTENKSGELQSNALFTESDIEVTPKDKQKAIVKLNKNKKDKTKANTTKTNNTNETRKKIDLKDAGNPIMVILISIFTVLGLGVLKKQ